MTLTLPFRMAMKMTMTFRGSKYLAKQPSLQQHRTRGSDVGLRHTSLGGKTSDCSTEGTAEPDVGATQLCKGLQRKTRPGPTQAGQQRARHNPRARDTIPRELLRQLRRMASRPDGLCRLTHGIRVVEVNIYPCFGIERNLCYQ